MKKNKKRINTSKVVIIFSLILIVVIVLYTSLNSGIFNSDNIIIIIWRCYMERKDTTMTIFIDDALKKKAKVNALMSNKTLKEYIAYLIEEDCKRGNINGKKMD